MKAEIVENLEGEPRILLIGENSAENDLLQDMYTRGLVVVVGGKTTFSDGSVNFDLSLAPDPDVPSSPENWDEDNELGDWLTE